MGIEVPDGDYATVAGFVLSALGHLPSEPGDVVDVEPWRLTVTAVDDRAITEVRITRHPATPPTRKPLPGRRK
ncbi:MAG: transporter associated domain-containing protein [Acidimicrobiales bacterium]